MLFLVSNNFVYLLFGMRGFVFKSLWQHMHLTSLVSNTIPQEVHFLCPGVIFLNDVRPGMFLWLSLQVILWDYFLWFLILVYGILKVSFHDSYTIILWMIFAPVSCRYHMRFIMCVLWWPAPTWSFMVFLIKFGLAFDATD